MNPNLTHIYYPADLEEPEMVSMRVNSPTNLEHPYGALIFVGTQVNNLLYNCCVCEINTRRRLSVFLRPIHLLYGTIHKLAPTTFKEAASLTVGKWRELGDFYYFKWKDSES